MNRRHRDGMQVRRIAAEEGREYVLVREGEGGFLREDGPREQPPRGSGAGAGQGQAGGEGRVEAELRMLEEADDDSDLDIQIVLPSAAAPKREEEEDLAWEDVTMGGQGTKDGACDKDAVNSLKLPT